MKDKLDETDLNMSEVSFFVDQNSEKVIELMAQRIPQIETRCIYLTNMFQDCLDESQIYDSIL